MKNYKFKINNHAYAVDIVNLGDNMATVNVNGVLYDVELEPKLKNGKTVLPKKDFVPSTDIPAPQIRTKSENGISAIKSPLPGKVFEILVKTGEKVSIGQTVICIEAMKMENNIRSDKEGVVKTIHVQMNDVVAEGNVLLEIAE